jgi:hypothetical protein
MKVLELMMSSALGQVVCAPPDDGAYMESTNGRFLKATELDVQELCDQYRALDQRRLELDQHIMASPEGDQDQEALWQEQEAVLRQLHELVAQLAAMPAMDSDDLRNKADVLARLLRTFGIDATAIDPPVMALALSVADDVARFVR